MIKDIVNIKAEYDRGIPLKELSIVYGVNYNDLCNEWKSRGWGLTKTIVSFESTDIRTPTFYEIDRLAKEKLMKKEEKESRRKRINERLSNNQFLMGINRKFV